MENVSSRFMSLNIFNSLARSFEKCSIPVSCWVDMLNILYYVRYSKYSLIKIINLELNSGSHLLSKPTQEVWGSNSRAIGTYIGASLQSLF